MRKWQFILASAAMATIVVTPIGEAATHYKVEKGDTLSKIATKHNTTVALLKEWNSLQNDRIYVDQKLIISTKHGSNSNGSSSTSPNGGVTNKPSHDTSKISTYTVVKGDNLTKIAIKNKTTVANLKEWNGLTSDKIAINQQLIIRQVGQGLNDSVDPVVPGDVTTGTQQPSETSADEEIAKKLAAETKIMKNPSARNIEKYSKTVELAHSLLGTPYAYGGNSVNGFDCSGFINYIYTNTGIDITRKSSLDYFMNDTTIVANPLPGDIVFFKNTYIATISHMGIYIGDNQFIHAGTSGVEISNLSYDYWDERYVAFKRFNVVE
ncbi:LysM peptidoglycan-binding domain-containing protein [Lysinibacillus sp. KU-BSD001]|uniref:C40 family peptidase n=1 Tax=Lysinibacillus sp. KU-BSD001 TaxID=3141328 RepID=UPI0036E98A59